MTGAGGHWAMGHLSVVSVDDLEEYPLPDDERIDSHRFIPWEHRRWLTSDMGLRGTPECRAYYFDLICHSLNHTPPGTLPTDLDLLARLLRVDGKHFEQLCRLEYGPLHRWRPVRCGDAVRLYHPMVLRVLTEAMARREDHRARSEAAVVSKRQLRLRQTLAGYHGDLAKNDAAVLWIDHWLVEQGCGYRSAVWIERAMQAWTNHMLDLDGGRGGYGRGSVRRMS